MAEKPINLPLVTLGTMLATFMQALDTTIANVALPHMQGSFAASQDQITWVLTSYIVAAAVMTPPTGWLSNRFGRKRLFLISVAGFTAASVLCGLADTLTEMVLFRILQGMCGAALVPLSQAVLLDSYPKDRHGQAMAIWGMGAVVGPVLGPSLGGWLTEHYTWRWVFYINVPFGILAFLVISAAVAETKIHKGLRFDAFGFAAISLAIASFQMFLDRGQQLDWFGSTEIVIEVAVAALAFYVFIVHIFTTEHPFIDPALFKDRNFTVSVGFMGIVGVVLFATMALLPPMLQDLMNFPVFTVGMVLAPRGIGTIFAMLLVGRLIRHVDVRWLMGFGLAMSAYSLWRMVGFSIDLPQWEVVSTGIAQGFGLGFVYVPMTSVAFSTLPASRRNEATGVFNLMRNIGASVGISITTSLLIQNAQKMHSALAAHITPNNPLLQLPAVHRFWDLGTTQGLAALNAEITRQATMIGYLDAFKLMMILTFAMIPFLVLLSPAKGSSESVVIAD